MTHLPSGPFEMPLLRSSLHLVKNRSYVRNGHLTSGPKWIVLLVVSAVLHIWYKQQLQHAQTLPNADAPWQGLCLDPGTTPKL